MKSSDHWLHLRAYGREFSDTVDKWELTLYLGCRMPCPMQVVERACPFMLTVGQVCCLVAEGLESMASTFETLLFLNSIREIMKICFLSNNISRAKEQTTTQIAKATPLAL